MRILDILRPDTRTLLSVRPDFRAVYPIAEYICVEFYSDTRAIIDGLTVSIDDNHSNADACAALAEHIEQSNLAYATGSLLIYRSGEPNLLITFAST